MSDLPLTEADLDRLEELLDAPELADAMRLDEMQAYFFATLAGPSPIALEEMLDEIFGDESTRDAEVAIEAEALIRRFLKVQQQALDADDARLILYPADEGEDSELEYGTWAMAYLHGIDASPVDWFEGLDDDELDFIDNCLFPLMVLSGEAEAAATEHGEEWPEGEERDKLIADAQGDVVDAVADIHKFWRAKQNTQTIRRDAPKVGRNDPCPCGSGKKYKQCCGKV